jgi:hypothetical protein
MGEDFTGPRYSLLEVLGAGAVGIVHAAHDDRTGQWRIRGHARHRLRLSLRQDA